MPQYRSVEKPLPYGHGSERTTTLETELGPYGSGRRNYLRRRVEKVGPMFKPNSMMKMFLLFCLSLAMHAQNPAATVTGRVTDVTKSGVPQAAVRIRCITTGESRHVESGAGGEFTITNLAPDKYELFVEKNGFRGLHETDIELQVNQTARFELQLEVGAVTQTLDVKANVPLLNTENSTKGDVVISQEISEMPLNGRSFSDLAYLVPSVEPSAQGGDGSGFNIGGARADQTNFVIDGFQSRNSRRRVANVTEPRRHPGVQNADHRLSGRTGQAGRRRHELGAQVGRKRLPRHHV